MIVASENGRRVVDLASLDLTREAPEAATESPTLPVASPAFADPAAAAPAARGLSLAGLGLEREGEALGRAVVDSTEHSPDEMARILRASRATGAPPQVVAGDPRLQKAADAPAVDWARLEGRAPVLSRRLSQDPTVLGVTRDDLLGLAALEEEFKQLRRTGSLSAAQPRGVFQRMLDGLTGYDPAKVTAAGAAELEARRQGKSFNQLMEESFGREASRDLQANQGGFWSGLLGSYGSMLEGVDWLTDTKAFQGIIGDLRQAAMQAMPEDPTFVNQLASGAGSMASYWVPGLGLAKGATALGNVSLRLARWLGVGASGVMEALTEAGSTYQDARDKGMNAQDADRAASLTFWVNIPFTIATNRLGVFGERGGGVLRSILGGVMEGSQEVGQDLISSGALGEDVTLKQLATSFGVGALLGGPAAVATGKVLGTLERPARDDATRLVDALDRRLAQSPAAKRDPETVGRLVAEVARAYGAPDQLYLPAEALQTLFQGKPEINPLQVLEDLGIGEGQAQEALRLGTPLAIPTERLVSAVLSPAWAEFKGQLSFTPREAQPPRPAAEATPPGENRPGPEATPAPTASGPGPAEPARPAPLLPLERMAQAREAMRAAGASKQESQAAAVLMGRAAMNWARQTGEAPEAWPRWEQVSFERGTAEGAEAGELAQSDPRTRNPIALREGLSDEQSLAPVELPMRSLETSGRVRGVGKETLRDRLRSAFTGAAPGGSLTTASGQAIQIREEAWRHPTRIGKPGALLALAEQMPDLLRQAHAVGDTPASSDQSDRRDNVFYAVPARTADGTTYVVRFQTKRNLKGEESLYDIKVFKKASGPSAANRASGDLKATTDGVSSGPDNFSLRQLGELVKRYEDEVQARVRSTLDQAAPSAPKGSVTFLEDGRAIIRFFEHGDASTIPHELAHVFRRDLEELAAREEAAPQVRRDWATACEYAGATPGQAWSVEQEEKFARAFEGYLREGKAPSPELRGLFDRFRRWLTGIYRSVRDLGINLDPAMREVFDRLLASDEEIARVRASEAVQPLFVERPAWMPEGVWAAYQKLAEDARQSVAEKVLKHRLGDWRKAKKGWEEDARREYREDPATRGLRLIQAEGLVNSADLAQDLAPESVRALEARGLAGPEGKLTLAEVAGLLESEPGAAASYLMETPTEREFVARAVQAQTEEWDANQATWEAALTDEVLALARAEAEALVGGARIQSDLPLKSRIRQTVESQSLGELDRKLVSERDALRFGLLKAQRAAAKALREGRREGAHAEKLRQWEIAARLKARQDAAAEIRKMRSDLKRLLRNRPKPGSGIEWEYDVQIRHLLANHGIGREHDKLPPRTQPLARFVEGLQAAGEAIQPPAWIMDEERTPLKDLTLARLRDLHATALSLAHIGRGQNEMLAHMRGTSYLTVKTRLIEIIAAQGRQRFAAGEAPEFNRSALGRLGQRWHDAVANNTKLEFLVFQLGGGERLGTVWDILFKGIKQAEDAQLRLEKRFSRRIAELMKSLPKEFAGNLDKKRHFDFLPQRNKWLTNEQILAMALNMGNQGNLDALLAGWGLDRGQLDRIVATLPPEAWSFVQGAWDLLDELFPPLDDTNYRMTGTRLMRVAPLAFTAPGGRALRGGYYPLKWDPEASPQAAAYLRAQAENNYFENPHKSGRPEQGMTMQRVGGKMAPLLSLSVIQKHVADSIRYATHAPIIRDLNRLLNDQQVVAAMTPVIGEAKLRQFKPWLQGIARPDVQGLTGLDRFAARTMSNYAVAALAYSLKTVFLQPLALYNAMAEIGPAAAVGGVLRYLAAPQRLGDWIEEASPYMANRREAMDRDLRQALSSKSRLGKGWDTFTRQWGFYLIGLADSITARAAWLGAYDQELRLGGDQARALERADQVARLSQGSGMPKDLPQVQRGTPLHRAFTMFYTPFAATYNQIADAHLSRDPLTIIRAWSWAVVVPALLGALADWGWDRLKGGRDEELTAWRLLAGIPDYALGMLPYARLARPVVPEVINLAAGERVLPSGYAARGLPFITDPINKGLAALRQTQRGDYGKAAVNALQALGPLTGIPANAIGSGLKIARNLED